jgi:hypothetical protein
MAIGFPKILILLATIILFYTIDFVLIRRYDEQRPANRSERAWDFIFLPASIPVLHSFQAFGETNDSL